MRGETCHVPDEGPVYHGNGVHGGAEALHVEVAPAADGVADIVAQDGNMRVEFLFPFAKDLG